MNQIGIFYEIGAASAVHRYLLEDAWREASKDFPNAIRFEDFPHIDSWHGYFVDCDPECAARTLHILKDYKNYTWVQTAIGAENTLKSFVDGRFNIQGNEDANSAWHSVTYTNTPKDFYWNPISVHKKFLSSQITLDMLFENIQQPVDFLSIDIEGAEYEALKNYSWQWKPKVFLLDYHGQHFEFYVELFHSKGYENLFPLSGHLSMKYRSTNFTR